MFINHSFTDVNFIALNINLNVENNQMKSDLLGREKKNTNTKWLHINGYNVNEYIL